MNDSGHPVRVRFCPAPSGWLHVGGARTALFNWLWARQHDGVFVLRIEDTDADRATIESAEGMMAALRWLGLHWDEGIGTDAPYGPYLQSERRALHQSVARRLLEAGHAYEAYESPERLASAREAGQHVYKRDMPGRATEGADAVLRVATPTDGTIAFDDAVRGAVTYPWGDISDVVILRADGSPTYMLANVVDDLAQGISLVARGEDLLAATPRQLHLTRLLLDTGILAASLLEVGYAPRPADAPEGMAYAHLPLLVGEDRKKLSKRHGDVAIDAFDAEGFLPEVMLNFLALCGWSYDGERERFSVEELVEVFSFDRVSSNPAYFDRDKLRSLNGDAIKEMSEADLTQRLVPAFQRAGLVADPPTSRERALLEGFAPLLRERSQTLAEAPPFVAFAFREEIQWDDKAVKKWLKPGARDVLAFVIPRLEALGTWDADSIMGVFTAATEELGVGMGKAMQPVRVVLTGSAVSPPLPETLAVLDRDWAMARIRAGMDRVPAPGA